MNRRTLLAAFAVVLLSVPVGIAEWRGRGFYEPDTARDVTSGFNWNDPDQTAGPLSTGKVYFSGVPSQSAGYAFPINPNNAVTGSQILPYPSATFVVLGLWKDCNKDGYIGLPETALLGAGQPLVNVPGIAGSDGTYRSALLSTTDVCPVATGSWNDGTNVREFWPIGPNSLGKNDPTARAWADWGLPEDAGTASCPVNPRPRGTYQSTGGFLRYADCMTSWRATGAVNAVAQATGVSAISFADAPQERPDQSGSLLNQKNPYGHESDAGVVNAFDCESGREAEVRDPTGQAPTEAGGFLLTNPDGTYAWVGKVNPSANPSGSPNGAMNDTTENVNVAARGSDSTVGSEGSCDRSDDNGGGLSGDIYSANGAIEDDFEATTAKRSQNDFWYQYAQGNGVWYGQPSYVVSRNPYVSRETLAPWGGVYVTYYANVADTTGVLPSLAAGIYGSTHCSGTTEITGAFHCDGEKWWRGPNGEDIANQWNIKPGQPYRLIDMDCYDASPGRGLPGTGDVFGNACARP